MRRQLYLLCGCFAVALGAIGAFLPLLPTVPFMILAAFCFARSSPQLEEKLLGHPHFGPHIMRWREQGAISRRAKIAALPAFGLSALMTLMLVPLPWSLIGAFAAAAGSYWIWTRPEA